MAFNNPPGMQHKQRCWGHTTTVLMKLLNNNKLLHIEFGGSVIL